MKEMRAKKAIADEESGALTFLYETIIGRMILKVLIHPWFSKLVGNFMNSHLSVILIKPFMRKNNIDIIECEECKYKSYNDFFTRKLKLGKRIINRNKNAFIAPCDSKLTAYRIDESSLFTIKGTPYSIKELLRDESLAASYQNGYCLIFRLSVDDHHRYCYIDDGTKEDNHYIRGVLHTVRPIALDHHDIYKENAREYTVLHTKNFGDVIQIEVGALLVGRIKNHHDYYRFSKGEEKGFFEFGGSTIVLLLKEGYLDIDNDIWQNTCEGYETIVKLGMKIGIRKKVKK